MKIIRCVILLLFLLFSSACWRDFPVNLPGSKLGSPSPNTISSKHTPQTETYISATPSENTMNFCLHQGCVLARNVDQELYALEPDDIHLEYNIPE